MNDKLKTLRTLINEYFSLRDLKDVAFDLGIEPDSLRHNTKPEFTLDLISHLGQAEKLTELVDYLKELRQGVAWPNVTAADFDPAHFEPQSPSVTHVHIGDTISMSGDFRGSIVNMKSTLTHVQQSIGRIPHGEDSDKAELARLITELTDVLEAIPPARAAPLADDVEAVAQTSKTLVDLANEEDPNATMLQLTGNMLKQAAEKLVSITPAVLSIATNIVATIHKITSAA